MSELIVFGYPDHDAARKAYEQVQSLHRDHIVDLNGLAVVTVDSDGKSHVDTPGRIVGGSAASGALWGVLFGVLFLVPIAGAVFGGVLGAVMGRLGKSGIDASFRERVDSMLTPGRAAVVIMASKYTRDKFTDAMKPFGGEVLQTSLSDADERELTEGLATT
jgi:uncharacterized membrane protein